MLIPLTSWSVPTVHDIFLGPAPWTVTSLHILVSYLRLIFIPFLFIESLQLYHRRIVICQTFSQSTFWAYKHSCPASKILFVIFKMISKLFFSGEKPFECPKCHVIFSTKSNRERHLTRKHGVNMLDPAARQTMDRPFKCHLCTFSSFATKGILLDICYKFVYY